jgi:hypothetical protein
MQNFDLCLAWNWPYDSAFVERLARIFQKADISLYQATPANLDVTIQALEREEICFKAFFDRASDVDNGFTPLVEWACQRVPLYINHHQLAHRAWNKAAMHRQLTQAGLDAPYTIILPSLQEQPDLPELDLSPLGNCFAIKPAHGGSGQGVVLDATQWEQVLLARQQFPNDQYLVQATVTPTWFDGHPAWFRVIYCVGQVFVSWWNPCTHIYTPLSFEERKHFNLDQLWEITWRIASLSQLELFSSEIAYAPDKRFKVIDYINDPIDLRPQSETVEGVPDAILEEIAQDIAIYIIALK